MNARNNFAARGTQSLLQKQFIAQVLTAEGSQILREQDEVITRHNLNRTAIMSNRRGFSLKGHSNPYGGNLELFFVKYLRFHDMRRDGIKGGYHTIFDGRHRQKATRQRRAHYHLYNRIVFGRLNAIMAKLQFGFTDAVKASIAQHYNIPI